jgi:hypothetical protein
MFWIAAQHPHHPAAADDLAVFAHALNGSSHFHDFHLSTIRPRV